MKKLKQIFQDPHPALRKKATEVVFPLSKEDEDTALYLYEHLTLADKLIGTGNTQQGVGLAAPQIGISKRMFALRIPTFNGENEHNGFTSHILINPVVLSKSVVEINVPEGERCLSVKKVYKGEVPRAASIKFRAYDLLLKSDVEITFRGYEAIVAQHEFDHLDGILYYDRIKK
jgi:peptide deformylase